MKERNSVRVFTIALIFCEAIVEQKWEGPPRTIGGQSVADSKCFLGSFRPAKNGSTRCASKAYNRLCIVLLCFNVSK